MDQTKSQFEIHFSDFGTILEAKMHKKSEKNGKVVINVKLNKRYITLAPIANLMGIAFHLKDPNTNRFHTDHVRVPRKQAK